jgi:acetolactate synthase I/II/III large subunit
MGTTRSVASSLILMLQECGISRVFGIPGGTISPVFDALLDTKIKFVSCQHETMAVYSARGYARATNRPGTVLVTSGPGILNAITGIAAAHATEAPIIVIAGDVATSSAGRGALQDGGPGGLDLVHMLAPITKFSMSLVRGSRAAPLVAEAITAAMAPPRGPVFLNLPVDVARMQIAAMTRHTAPTLPPGSAIESSRRIQDACRRVAGMLVEARRPVLLAGIGARHAQAGPLLLQLAETADCPVITDIEGKGIIPESHPLALGVIGVGARGSAAAYIKEGVDLIISVGSRFDDTTTNNYGIIREGVETLVQLDYDRRRLGRGYAADYTFACEIPLALEGILRELPALGGAAAETRRELRLALRTSPPPVRAQLGAPPHDPRSAATTLIQQFDQTTVFTADIGNHMLFTAECLESENPERFHVDVGLGGMGSGLGTAIGLQLGYGSERQVVCVIGDGGLLMVGNEIATCVEQKLPLVIAVFNDGHLGMVRHGYERIYGRSDPYTTPRVNIAEYARSLGAQGVYVDSEATLKRALREPRTVPLVLDIPINPRVEAQNPREATVNFPSLPSE